MCLVLLVPIHGGALLNSVKVFRDEVITKPKETILLREGVIKKKKKEFSIFGWQAGEEGLGLRLPLPNDESHKYSKYNEWILVVIWW